MKNIIGSYDKAWKLIVVPDKFEFSDHFFRYPQENSKGELLKRLDFTVTNPSGEEIKAFIVLNQNRPQCDLPCLVYLHSHSGTKVESTQIADPFLDEFNFCALDFSGYGDSQGEYSSLGLKEQADLREVVRYLSSTLDIEDVYLWGRSMGAVSGILYASHELTLEDPGLSGVVKGMVLDSPFTEAKTMICDMITSKANMPRFLVKAALMPIASTIKKQTKYDVLGNNPCEKAKYVPCPVYTFVGENDVIARPDRVKQMAKKFPNKKGEFLVIPEDEHNSFRDESVVLGAFNWLWGLVEEEREKKAQRRAHQDSEVQLEPGEDYIPTKESQGILSVSTSKEDEDLAHFTQLNSQKGNESENSPHHAFLKAVGTVVTKKMPKPAIQNNGDSETTPIPEPELREESQKEAEKQESSVVNQDENSTIANSENSVNVENIDPEQMEDFKHKIEEIEEDLVDTYKVHQQPSP